VRQQFAGVGPGKIVAFSKALVRIKFVDLSFHLRSSFPGPTGQPLGSLNYHRNRKTIMASTLLRYKLLILIVILLFIVPQSGPADTLPIQSSARSLQGCTTFYAYDGQVALGGNNEDFNNPLTFIWFVPASPGRFGRVYFGFDDYIPQGGLNDQGVFFDALGLPYKAMPDTSQRPHFPGGDLALWDEILSRSANIQDVIDIASRWSRVAGEYSQLFYGDRHGKSVILDGDTILRKQGAFHLATNFRLVDHPNPPYPNKRYGILNTMLSQSNHYSMELFRQALDAAHAEGKNPTLYSQVYELNTGIIHLYQFHDFQHEVVLNLADELSQGPHYVTIASLFPKNDELDKWTSQRLQQQKTSNEGLINTIIKSESQDWMSGQYTLAGEADSGSVKVYLENNQLYMQKANQWPVELYPITPDTVFHLFLNGMDLTLTFQRNLWRQTTGAEGTFSFKPYNIFLSYKLVRPGVVSFNTSVVITLVSIGIVLLLLFSVLYLLRRGRNTI
jgi:hypothetical protein